MTVDEIRLRIGGGELVVFVTHPLRLPLATPDRSGSEGRRTDLLAWAPDRETSKETTEISTTVSVLVPFGPPFLDYGS